MKPLFTSLFLISSTFAFGQTEKILECSDEDIRVVIQKKNGVINGQYFRKFPSRWVKMDDTKMVYANGGAFISLYTSVYVHKSGNDVDIDLLTKGDSTCDSYCVIRDCTDYGLDSL